MSIVAPCLPNTRTPSPASSSAHPPSDTAARLLHPSGAGGLAVVAPEVLEALAADLVLAAGPDDLTVPDVAGDSRRHRRLVQTQSFDAWLIAWGPSSVLDLHDHGGSVGVVSVIRGELIETYSDKLRRHALRSLAIGAGGRRLVPATRVHEVWNPGPCPALSVHVYSPPLRAITFFDHHPDRFLCPLRTERGDAASLEAAPSSGYRSGSSSSA